MTHPSGLTVWQAVLQSQLCHPDWTPPIHVHWLNDEGFDLDALTPERKGLDTVEELIAQWLAENVAFGRAEAAPVKVKITRTMVAEVTIPSPVNSDEIDWYDDVETAALKAHDGAWQLDDETTEILDGEWPGLWRKRPIATGSEAPLAP